jgi:hypothetical protein
MTDWDRSEGKGETKRTWIPFLALLTAQDIPAIPLPITMMLFIFPPYPANMTS